MRNAARSYEVFFDEYYEPVRRALAVALADPVLAEDSAQEAFARAYVQWRSVSAMERPAGWVYVVALRGGRRQRSRRVETVAPAPEPDPIPTLVERDELDELLRRLPDRQRIAVVLRYLADLPLVDVAAAMGCAVGTVKSTLHVALARLRVELHDLDEESWSDARG
ncbi:MAG TPA: sigma-70 family RNA polymerase sigma factor [Acidimicrobiia bacterium]